MKGMHSVSTLTTSSCDSRRCNEKFDMQQDKNVHDYTLGTLRHPLQPSSFQLYSLYFSFSVMWPVLECTKNREAANKEVVLPTG